MSTQQTGTSSQSQTVLPTLDIDHGHSISPTLHVPLVTKTMQYMLKILNEGCIWDLGLYLKRQAEHRLILSKEKQTLIGEKTSMELVLEPEGFENLMQLLHTQSKETLAAVILSTVGYQSLHDQARRSKFEDTIERPITAFSGDGPGAYIATLHVKDRNGWLTKTELGNVIELLKDYLKISLDESLWQKLAKDRSPDEQVDVSFINDIDRMHAPNAIKSQSIYLRPDTRKSRGPRLEAFIQGLQRMHDSMMTDDDYAVQSPQYVGCSSLFANGRSDAHDPDSRNYSGCNFLLWLTSSCMKMSGILPKVLRHPVLRTWKPNQVKVAEVLLTMLSSSMCWQFGLNSHPPGTSFEIKDPSKGWVVHQKVVIIDNLSYQENIKQSKLGLVTRGRLVNWLESEPENDLKKLHNAVNAYVNENERQKGKKWEDAEISLNEQKQQISILKDIKQDAIMKIENY